MLNKKYILECLDEYCTFEGLCEDTFYDLVVSPLQDAECFKNWTYDSGVSKGVLIFDEVNFVIKIPFEGQGEYYESYCKDRNGHWQDKYATNADEKIENGEWVKKEGEEVFRAFGGAIIEDDEDGIYWDYCRLESYYYEKAVAAGVEKCFAKTEFIGEVHGHPIYCQEKCSMFGSEFHSTEKQKEYEKRTEEDYRSMKQICDENNFHRIDRDWTLDFLIYWGEQMFAKFAEFVKSYDIWDLHNGNIGYKNGAPCLVDYSSYEG